MLKVAIIPNKKKDSQLEVTKKLVSLLGGRAEIIVPAEFEGKLQDVQYAEDVYSVVDVAIVIGGDGTVINSALPCAKADIPMLGINLGRVGFMSEVELCSIDEAMESFLKGDYEIEERMMMSVQISGADGDGKCFHALNDAVIEKAKDVKLIGLELFSDNEKISQYVADGIIVSTPTGSTGYNLSAGGPVVNPLMSLFVATAICPHMLTARPAVMPADKPIIIKLGGEIEGSAVACVDGEPVGQVNSGDRVIITKSQYSAKLIKIVRRSFYDTIIEKML